MVRTVIAAFVGAGLSLVTAFVVVAVIGAVAGMPIPFDADKAAYGWEGAQLGVLLFVAIGLGYVWPFPAILLVGAAVGVLTAWSSRSPVMPAGLGGWGRPG